MTYGYRCVFTCILFGMVGAVLLAGARCEAEEVFEPYHVYVDQEGVTARCGPGGEYYRTDPLRHGQRLEVYLETADGWLGVRPPEGSFCWVPADSVKLNRGESTGRITEEATLAWIGTHLGKARKYLWQIQMPRGEDVTILGRAEREGPDGPQLWYRIVPPSGEFRWVHRDQVVDNPELLLRDKPRRDDRVAQGTPTPVDDASLGLVEQTSARRSAGAAPQSVLQPNSLAEASGPRSGDPEPVQLHPLIAAEAIPIVIAPLPGAGGDTAVSTTSYAPDGSGERDYGQYEYALPAAISPQPIGSGVIANPQPPLMAITSQPSVQPIGAVVDESKTVQASDGGWVRGTERPGRGGELQGPLQVGTSRPQDQPAMISPRDAVPFGGATQAGGTVDALQLELTRRMVASSPAAEIEPLRQAAEAIARNHASESERQRARLLAQRMEQVQSVARRRDGESEPSRQQPIAGSGASIPTAQVTSLTARAPASEVSGYLVQVYSARPDSPPFALTDASGRTTHYVSPSPGVNLRRYLNQHITIAGQSGYETGLDTPHLIASGAVRSPELR